jgi:hypothetical protein
MPMATDLDPVIHAKAAGPHVRRPVWVALGAVVVIAAMWVAVPRLADAWGNRLLANRHAQERADRPLVMADVARLHLGNWITVKPCPTVEANAPVPPLKCWQSTASPAQLSPKLVAALRAVGLHHITAECLVLTPAQGTPHHLCAVNATDRSWTIGFSFGEHTKIDTSGGPFRSTVDGTNGALGAFPTE